MNWINDLLNIITRETFFEYPYAEFALVYLPLILLNLLIIYIAYRRSTQVKLFRSESRALLGTLICNCLQTILLFFDMLYEIVTNDHTHTLGLIVVQPIIIAWFFFYLGRYSKSMINLSERVKKALLLIPLIMFGWSIILTLTWYLRIPDIDALSWNNSLGRSSIIFNILMISLIIGAALIDLFRISSSLKKLRLGLIILSCVSFLTTGVFLVLWDVFMSSASTIFLGHIMFVIAYWPNILVAITLYWSFFVPVKLQEWAGVLPPSFKLLKEKQIQQITSKTGTL
ncbi:MAG: hypothetical protein ACFFBD_10835 [Candidatus Hodarchaeota archaeon]